MDLCECVGECADGCPYGEPPPAGCECPRCDEPAVDDDLCAFCYANCPTEPPRLSRFEHALFGLLVWRSHQTRLHLREAGLCAVRWFAAARRGIEYLRRARQIDASCDELDEAFARACGLEE